MPDPPNAGIIWKQTTVDTTSPRNKLIKANATSIASYTAGMCGVLAGFPLDNLKTRMQTHKFQSMRDCAQDTLRHEGLFGFFRGVVPPLLTTSLLKSIAFTLYERVRRELRQSLQTNGIHPVSECFVAGFTSGTVVAALSAPLDMVKVQMQLQHLSKRSITQNTVMDPKYSSSWHCFRTLLKQGGIGLLYRGFAPQVWREGLGFGTYFASYEYLCMKMSPTGRRQDAGPLVFFLSGGISGMLIWTVIFPFDLVKARLQNEATMPQNMRTYTGAWDCVRKTWNTGRIRAFYSGISPSLLRAFPVHSLIFLVYETTLATINKM